MASGDGFLAFENIPFGWGSTWTHKLLHELLLITGIGLIGCYRAGLPENLASPSPRHSFAPC